MHIARKGKMLLHPEAHTHPQKKPQLNAGGNEEDSDEALWYLHGVLYPHVSKLYPSLMEKLYLNVLWAQGNT